MRFVHALHAGALSADVAGQLGARLGGLIGVDLPVAPGFVIGTSAWRLARVTGADRDLPATVAEEMRRALGDLDSRLVTVRAARAAPGADAGSPALDLPRATAAEELEAILRSAIHHAAVPTAVIVQARVDAEGKPPSGNGRAFTRDPLHGTVWPTGVFRSGGSAMSLDGLSRRAPALGVQLRAALARVEALQRGVSEVTFTIETGRLWIDDARPVRHSRVAAERIAQSGLGEPVQRLKPAPATGPGS
ncbi:MAG: pyruvate, orthophosphate dikinase [Solirubrobacteraceae bacterium]|jgi:hypothetical protein|nr:pyruvate, orthophosphate dikinase [Solirubrobacteraceae bacterium]